ncbi:unnamed protein product [Paramecium octaurelia]|uniref:Uncharacterized protein n=1 Tax=Paramecium octaurelia TaxID=43137 RepID=A0A8S1V5U1_PAROT|nr:unnamed protein product [Paramecium octaurelia]
MSQNNTSQVDQNILPSIDHKPYSENTQYITDNIKQKYNEINKKIQEPQVQEKLGQVTNVLFTRTKEFGYITLDYFVKTFEITKTTFTDLHQLYHK